MGDSEDGPRPMQDAHESSCLTINKLCSASSFFFGLGPRPGIPFILVGHDLLSSNSEMPLYLSLISEHTQAHGSLNIHKQIAV